MSKLLVITCPRTEESVPEIEAILEPFGYDVSYHPPDGQGFDSHEMCSILEKASIAIVGDDEIDASVIDTAKEIKLIIKWGVGMNQIDLDYAEKKSLTVVNSPSTLSTDVAEYTLLLMLLLLRKTNLVDTEIRNNNWYKPTGERLEGLDIGFIGFGNIGQSIYERIKNFNLNLFFYDPNVEESSYDLITKKDLRFIKQKCKIIILCCSLNDENYYLVDDEFIDELKNFPYIINVSRGQLIREDSLLSALDGKKIAGAALDVFEQEPLSTDSKLKSYKNVVLSSHNASNTFEANSDVNGSIINQLKDWVINNE